MRQYPQRRFLSGIAIIVSIAGIALSTPQLRAQATAGEQAANESRYIVDMPTAGVLAKSRFAFDGYVFGNSGVMAEFTASPFTNLQLGISFGGSGFLGNNSIIFQSLPGFHARFRPLDETLTIPAVTVGFSSQGRGEYSGGRFLTHSPGIFVSASKNFVLWGSLAVHGGINYSFDPVLSERFPNAYIGIEKTIGNIVSLSIEYNPTLDDPRVRSRGGLLNTAIRVSTGRGFTVEVQVRDLFSNLPGATLPYRMARIEFIGAF
ncbi:MAG: hypothetical protein ACOVSW_16665 [Candidatus Kapaibacteriota bacterium]